jgi:hypothetical protein
MINLRQNLSLFCPRVPVVLVNPNFVLTLSQQLKYHLHELLGSVTYPASRFDHTHYATLDDCWEKLKLRYFKSTPKLGITVNSMGL